jgi:hypothetical protein
MTAPAEGGAAKLLIGSGNTGTRIETLAEAPEEWRGLYADGVRYV